MFNGPLPSERCLLSALRKKQIGDKVRFLGCVAGYSTRSAQVTLQHSYPKENHDIEALVDVKLLLETLKPEQTDAGQWVHVIGYLTFINPVLATDSRNARKGKAATRVGVQALVFWIAQDLDLGVYERSMMADANQNTVTLAPEHLDAGNNRCSER